MRKLLIGLMFAALPAQAWELIRAGSPAHGVYAITTIADVMAAYDGDAIRFGDQDGLEGCRMASNFNPPPPEELFTTIGGRFVVLMPQNINNNALSRLLPVALFAKAHNLRVLVLLKMIDGVNGRTCRVQSLTTCSDAQSCAALIPPERVR